MDSNLIVIIVICALLIGGVGFWIYAVAVLQPRVRAQRRAMFLSYVQHRQGTEIPLPDMDSLTIFDIGSEKMRQMDREAEQANPLLGSQQLYCTAQAKILLDGHEARVSFGTVAEDEEIATHVLFWRVQLSGSVQGWARLRSATSRFKGLTKDVQLESVDLHRDVRVHAHPTKLAYTLFAPDVLDWYLHQSHQPWVIVQDDSLFVVVEAMVREGVFEEYEREVQYFIKAIERSGALDKTVTSA